jgi:excisionase family DNA binding protein
MSEKEGVCIDSLVFAGPVVGPVVTKRLFAQLTGLTEETIRGMIERGHLPTVKIGKHRMVNVALLTKDALESEYER